MMSLCSDRSLFWGGCRKATKTPPWSLFSLPPKIHWSSGQGCCLSWAIRIGDCQEKDKKVKLPCPIGLSETQIQLFLSACQKLNLIILSPWGFSSQPWFLPEMLWQVTFPAHIPENETGDTWGSSLAYPGSWWSLLLMPDPTYVASILLQILARPTQ